MKEDDQLELPVDETSPDSSDGDFLICADIASIFIDNSDVNVYDSKKKIYEPSVLFRHIFRIKDGQKFAENFSSSKAKNDEYIKKQDESLLQVLIVEQVHRITKMDFKFDLTIRHR